MTDWLYLLVPLLLVSALYASIGHGGASGYLAVMALAGVAPEAMKPTALVFNLVVSCIGTVLFVHAGHFARLLFWPFASVSIPFAYLGGRLNVTAPVFHWLVAAVLFFAALRLLLPVSANAELRRPPFAAVLIFGAIIGLLSGLIGIGGGIFLTPLLLFFGWADTKTAAAVSAPFIMVNSIAALAGHPASLHALPHAWPWLMAAVVAGGLIGGGWGSRMASATHLSRALALVLVIAAVKFVII